MNCEACGKCMLLHVVGDASAWPRWPKGRQDIPNVQVETSNPCKACKERMRNNSKWKGNKWKAASGRVAKEWAAMQTN